LPAALLVSRARSTRPGFYAVGLYSANMSGNVSGLGSAT